MNEEPTSKFIDRLAMTKPKDISRADLLRYLQEPSMGIGITPSVKAALKLFVENHS